VIQEAELAAMPPVAVAEFMKRRDAESEHDARAYQVDEDAEMALLGRKEALIDLALARYSQHIGVVSTLFQAAAPRSPIRLACLSNSALRRDRPNLFPIGLLGRELGPLAEWLASASDGELHALFENPALSDSFLCDVLERCDGWSFIDDDRLCTIVFSLCGNPRMRTPRDDDYMDGYAEYNYASVFNAAWKLAETAPVTERWSDALGWLYEELVTDAYSIKEPLALAARWHVAPGDTEALKRQASDHAIGYLGYMERVRKGLARLALSKDHKQLAELLASDDVAFRAAAYSAGPLNAEQLRAGYEKDGALVLTEAISNLHLWRTQVTRLALHDVAWGVVRDDKHSDLMADNQYNRVEKDLRKKHPAWFADEEQRDEPGYDEVDDKAPATRADLSAISGHMDRQSQGLEALGQALRGLMRGTGWIWWFSLGALVASLRHF